MLCQKGNYLDLPAVLPSFAQHIPSFLANGKVVSFPLLRWLTGRMAWGEQAPIRPLPLTASRPTAQVCSGFGLRPVVCKSCIDVFQLIDIAYTEDKHLASISRTRELNQINLHAAVPVPYAAVRDSLPSPPLPRGRRHGQPAQIGSFHRSSRDWKLVGTS